MLSRYFLFVRIRFMIKIDCLTELELKKKHPCGGNIFIVLRLGSDIKLRCKNCQREVTLPRVKLEKMIRKILNAGKTEIT